DDNDDIVSSNVIERNVSSFSQKMATRLLSIPLSNVERLRSTLSRYTKAEGSKSYRWKLASNSYGFNPYKQALSIIWKTLAEFDEDNLILCYGFGDATTHGQHVFGFYPEDISCNGFEDVMIRCRENVPQLTLAEQTSFTPLIEQAMTIVGKVGASSTINIC
nr:hypothetical protein [Tanacetum cinerariifolium]